MTGVIYVARSARDVRVEAAAHDVVEWQSQAAAQFDRQRLFPGGHRGREAVRHVRAVLHLGAALPPRDGAAADTKLARQAGQRARALLARCPRNSAIAQTNRGDDANPPGPYTQAGILDLTGDGTQLVQALH